MPEATLKINITTHKKAFENEKDKNKMQLAGASSMPEATLKTNIIYYKKASKDKKRKYLQLAGASSMPEATITLTYIYTYIQIALYVLLVSY